MHLLLLATLSAQARTLVALDQAPLTVSPYGQLGLSSYYLYSERDVGAWVNDSLYASYADMHDFPFPPALSPTIWQVNDHGQVLFSVTDSTFTEYDHSVEYLALWTPALGQSYFAPNNGQRFSYTRAFLNNFGSIVGEGIDPSSGQSVPFYANPARGIYYTPPDDDHDYSTGQRAARVTDYDEFIWYSNGPSSEGGQRLSVYVDRVVDSATAGRVAEVAIESPHTVVFRDSNRCGHVLLAVCTDDALCHPGVWDPTEGVVRYLSLPPGFYGTSYDYFQPEAGPLGITPTGNVYGKQYAGFDEYIPWYFASFADEVVTGPGYVGPSTNMVANSSGIWAYESGDDVWVIGVDLFNGEIYAQESMGERTGGSRLRVHGVNEAGQVLFSYTVESAGAANVSRLAVFHTRFGALEQVPLPDWAYNVRGTGISDLGDVAFIASAAEPDRGYVSLPSSRYVYDSYHCPTRPDGWFPEDGDFAGDLDGDKVDEAVDICPQDFDPDQADADEDGLGDVCDDDDDDDGFLDTDDQFPVDRTESTDSDGDGVGDNADACPTDGDKRAGGDCGCGNPDIDGDGNDISDCLEAELNLDGDGSHIFFGNRPFATFSGQLELDGGLLSPDLRDGTLARGRIEVGVSGVEVYDNVIDFTVTDTSATATDGDNREKWEYRVDGRHNATFRWRNNMSYDSARDTGIPLLGTGSNVGRVHSRFIRTDDTRLRLRWDRDTTLPLTVTVDGIVLASISCASQNSRGVCTGYAVSSAFERFDVYEDGDRRRVIDFHFPDRLGDGNIVAWYHAEAENIAPSNLLYSHEAIDDGSASSTFYNAGGGWRVEVPLDGSGLTEADLREATVGLWFGHADSGAAVAGCARYADYVLDGRHWRYQEIEEDEGISGPVGSVTGYAPYRWSTGSSCIADGGDDSGGDGGGSQDTGFFGD